MLRDIMWYWDMCLKCHVYDCISSLHWRHNDRGCVSDHQPHDCLLGRLFRQRSKKTSKLRVTGLCAGNSPATGEFPAQRASNAENVSIWWRHHDVSAKKSKKKKKNKNEPVPQELKEQSETNDPEDEEEASIHESKWLKWTPWLTPAGKHLEL